MKKLLNILLPILILHSCSLLIPPVSIEDYLKDGSSWTNNDHDGGVTLHFSQNFTKLVKYKGATFTRPSAELEYEMYIEDDIIYTNYAKYMSNTPYSETDFFPTYLIYERIDYEEMVIKEYSLNGDLGSIQYSYYRSSP